MTEPVVIAVDGTSGSGKSTNSRLVAAALGYRYVDTGAMYRVLAWYCLDRGVPVQEESALKEVLESWNSQLVDTGDAVRLEVDGYYPEKEIRTAETSAVVSAVAAHPCVRVWMKARQRECLSFGSLVMEGRDIGSNIFPETPYKFYMDAGIDERQQRRAAEGVQENLAARDHLDQSRTMNPLVIPDGARLINTSGMTPEQSSQFLLQSIQHIRNSLTNPSNE